MKKALAALLASFVGLFGYQIADKALEERVSDLESSVSSLADQMNSQQYDADDDTTYQIPALPTVPTLPTAPTLPTQPISIGTKQEYSGQKKFLFREYSDGSIVYISLNNSASINESKIASTRRNANEEQAETPLTTKQYINDYFVYITDASRTITGADDIITKVYDEEYSIQNQVSGKEYTVRYIINGKADMFFANKEIVFYTSDDSSLKTIVNRDGTFKIDIEIKQTSLYENFNSLSPIPNRPQMILGGRDL